MKRYIAFLRGINVGGNKKVPMADLRKMLTELGYTNVVTILNSGNAIFAADTDDLAGLEKTLAENLEKTFGFPVPTIVRSASTISKLIEDNPFKDIEVTKETRLYVSFLADDPRVELQLPWASKDGSYRILDVRDQMILSVLDLSVTKTPKGMKALEDMFGKGITTRNWNTINRIGKKLL